MTRTAAIAAIILGLIALGADREPGGARTARTQTTTARAL